MSIFVTRAKIQIDQTRKKLSYITANKYNMHIGINGIIQLILISLYIIYKLFTLLKYKSKF